MSELRNELKTLLEQRENTEKRIKEISYLLYKEEKGTHFEGCPVECSGYKKILRYLGYVI